MAGGVDLLDKFGKPASSPSKNKERRGNMMLGQQVEHSRSIWDNAVLESIPNVTINIMFEGRNLKIIFYIDSEGVDDTFCGSVWRM